MPKLVASLLSICFVASSYGALLNPSFENDSGWIPSTNSDITGSYYDQWSSEGIRSYQFYRNTGGTGASYYAQITQNVDLTGVTGFIFDCQDTGIDQMPLQFMIDGQVAGEYRNNGHTDTGTSWGSTATVFDIGIDLAQQYTGLHAFTVRLQEIATYSPADAKYYRVDNVRVVLGTVPEPVSIGLLGLGGLYILARRNRLGSR